MGNEMNRIGRLFLASIDPARNSSFRKRFDRLFTRGVIDIRDAEFLILQRRLELLH